MTYQEINSQYGNSNYLSEKLIHQYKNREASLKGMKYTSTEELIRRAQNVNSSHKNASQRSVGNFEGQRRDADKRMAYKKNVQFSSSTYVPDNDRAARYAGYKKMQAERRRRAEYEMARAEEQRARELAYIKAYEKKIKRENSIRKKKERIAKNALKQKEAEELLKREKKINKQKMSLPFIIILITAACMIMGVVYSFAQVYASSRTLSEAKQSLRELEEASEDLELTLEQKNDIRTIEKQATEKIGMVKEDTVEKKYVSLSSGDYIELEDDENEGEKTGPIGTMLSSVSSAFGDFMDFFN